MRRSIAVIAALIGGHLVATAFAQNSADAAAQQPERVDVRLLSDPSNPWTEPSTLFGALGVLGGIAGVLIQRLWHRRDEQRTAERTERDRLQAHVLDSLKWFEGKTQKRSIGIAVIEGNWNTFADVRPTWLAVLTNQAVYLLAESGQEEAAHEQLNLVRIMALISRPDGNVSPDQGTSLVEAIGKNLGGSGLRGLDPQVLKGWREKFMRLSRHSTVTGAAQQLAATDDARPR